MSAWPRQKLVPQLFTSMYAPGTMLVPTEKRVLAESNAQLVAKAADIIKQLGGQAATAAQTRDMLNLNK